MKPTHSIQHVLALSACAQQSNTPPFLAHHIRNPTSTSSALPNLPPHPPTSPRQAYPLDLVRTRLAAQTTESYYRGIGHALRTIVQDEGLRGLYRGLGPTLLQVCAAGEVCAAREGGLRACRVGGWVGV